MYNQQKVLKFLFFDFFHQDEDQDQEFIFLSSRSWSRGLGLHHCYITSHYPAAGAARHKHGADESVYDLVIDAGE